MLGLIRLNQTGTPSRQLKAKDVEMPKVDYRNIEIDVARCGGQPVVSGTRIRVATILTCYRQGMSIEEIVQQYVSLRPADVHDALAFAYDHVSDIDAELVADEAAANPGSESLP